MKLIFMMLVALSVAPYASVQAQPLSDAELFELLLPEEDPRAVEAIVRLGPRLDRYDCIATYRETINWVERAEYLVGVVEDLARTHKDRETALEHEKKAEELYSQIENALRDVMAHISGHGAMKNASVVLVGHTRVDALDVDPFILNARVCEALNELLWERFLKLPRIEKLMKEVDSK